MKKTILFLDQQSWVGGAQRVLESVLASLGTEFDPIVAFPNHGPFRTALNERGIETLTIPIGIYQSGKKSWLEMAAFVVRSVLCGFRAAVIIRRRRVSLVYINGPRCLPAGVIASWLTGRPSLFHLHLILTRKAEVLLTTFLLRQVPQIVACSRAAAKSFLNEDVRLSGKTEVLYSPVSGPFISVSERQTAPHFTVGIVGRITEVKGHHVLLQAAGKLPPEIRARIRILIVGAPEPNSRPDGRYADDLRAIALQYGLQESIVWTGYQPDPGPLYALMDVLVHPALWAEAMGLVILEALQRGIPVIASRIGGIPEIIDDGTNGLLVPSGDSEALSQALAHFIDNGALRQRLQEGARAGVDARFTLQNFSPRIRFLVRRLCDVANPAETKTTDEEFAAWK